jgi:hypothetical protein
LSGATGTGTGSLTTPIGHHQVIGTTTTGSRFLQSSSSSAGSGGSQDTTQGSNVGLSQVASAGSTQLVTDLTNVGNVIGQVKQDGGQAGAGLGQDTQQGSGIGGGLGQLDNTGKQQDTFSNHPLIPRH